MSKRFLITLIFVLNALIVPALDFWQYPEAADKNSIFVGGFFSSFSFTDYFTLDYKVYADYVLPVGLPFSVGFEADVFDPETNSYGARLGYHINLGDENSDLYVLYAANLIITQSVPPWTGEYTAVAVGAHIGFRRRLGRFICFTVETGFKFQTIHVGISIKLN